MRRSNSNFKDHTDYSAQSYWKSYRYVNDVFIIENGRAFTSFVPAGEKIADTFTSTHIQHTKLKMKK